MKSKVKAKSKVRDKEMHDWTCAEAPHLDALMLNNSHHSTLHNNTTHCTTQKANAAQTSSYNRARD